jgi:hypothetical protein
VVRTALGDEEYERAKRRRTRRRSSPQAAGDTAAPEPLPTALAIADAADAESPGPDTIPGPAGAPAPRAAREDEEEDGPGVLAIEDADDFGSDDDEEDLLEEDEDGVDDADGAINPFQPIPVALLEEGEGLGVETRLQTLAASSLPASAYMLVDKSVELQARPLSDFPELGRLPAEELQRQALVVYLNPRQAKRQCGRSQRVIKVPDLKVFELTAPYLLAQGISRVVIEGALYALPGS